jgi:predicted GIY-YIG superfamily endonuclease
MGMLVYLKRRFEEHNQGRGGEYTKKQGKFRLVFYEAYIEKRMP